MTVISMVLLSLLIFIQSALPVHRSLPIAQTVPPPPPPHPALDDTLAWHEQAVWWNRGWRYRVPIDVTADVVLYDKIISTAIDWSGLFAELGLGEAVLDANSLRVVEYTPGGHIQYRHTGDVNRFETLPVHLSADRSTVEFLAAGRTAAHETRRFFLYFDTTENAKPAKAYYYFGQEQTTGKVSGYRGGPDLENVASPGAGIDLYTGPGGVFNLVRMEAKGVGGYYLYYPHYRLPGDPTYRGFTAAAYTSTLTPLYLEVAADLQGHGDGSGPLISGRAQLRLSHLFVDRKSYAVVEGTVQMDVHQRLRFGFGPPALAMLNSGITTDAWYTAPDGQVVSYAQGETLPLCTCADALVMKQTAYLVTLLQIHHAERRNSTQRAQSFSSSLFSASSAFSALDILSLDTVYDPFSQRVLFSSQADWQPGDTIRYQFTYLVAHTAQSYEEIRPILASLQAEPALVVGRPIQYSEALFDRQLFFYEAQAWRYIAEALIANGWGQPWNISYMSNVVTGENQPAHHADSSMGAGFILYAATLQAAMTGDPFYYAVADHYANYFLRLEQLDVQQHGQAVAGRISYFYNGSSQHSFEGVAPATVADRTSYDQMMTAAMGLWSYYHLDPDRIQYETAVRSLLLRMGEYTRREQSLGDDLGNVNRMLTSGGHWFLYSPQYSASGVIYQRWFLENQPQRFPTGGVANSFFISGMADRLQPHKPAAALRARYQGALADLATATKGYYALSREQGYPPRWGYVWGEFTQGQLYQSSAYEALRYDAHQSPAHYLDLAGHGGARDSSDGRGSTQDASIALWAALHEPEGTIVVAGEPRIRYIDYAIDAIHTAVAVLMHDNGGMRESAPGTLGNYSAVREENLTADFSGYFLLLMAYYHLYQRDVDSPMPMDRWDYIQGVAEHDGAVTVKYLGDGTLTQRFAVPRTDQAIVASGVLTTPVLTFDANGAVAKLVEKTLDFSFALPYGEMVAGTVAQVPLMARTEAGTVAVRVENWTEQERSWRAASLTPMGVKASVVHFSVSDLIPDRWYRLLVDGRGGQERLADHSGAVSFQLAGSPSPRTFQIQEGLPGPLGVRVYLPTILQ